MSYKVIPTSQFEKDLKKLFKKYPSVKSGHYGHSLSRPDVSGLGKGHKGH